VHDTYAPIVQWSSVHVYFLSCQCYSVGWHAPLTSQMPWFKQPCSIPSGFICLMDSAWLNQAKLSFDLSKASMDCQSLQGSGMNM
jgi:hypothetical protein